MIYKSYNRFLMSPSAIQEQINAIKRATEKALQSKEAALKFLISAGIIDQAEGKRASMREKQKK